MNPMEHDTGQEGLSPPKNKVVQDKDAKPWLSLDNPYLWDNSDDDDFIDWANEC